MDLMLCCDLFRLFFIASSVFVAEAPDTAPYAKLAAKAACGGGRSRQPLCANNHAELQLRPQELAAHLERGRAA